MPAFRADRNAAENALSHMVMRFISARTPAEIFLCALKNRLADQRFVRVLRHRPIFCRNADLLRRFNAHLPAATEDRVTKIDAVFQNSFDSCIIPCIRRAECALIAEIIAIEDTVFERRDYPVTIQIERYFS